jgi:hypothetical protein
VSGVSAFVRISQSELRLVATTIRSRHTVGGCLAKAAADGDGGHAGAETQGIATTAMSVNSMSRAGWRSDSGWQNSGLNVGIGSGPKDWMASYTSLSNPFGKRFGQSGTGFSHAQCSGTTCEKVSALLFGNNHPWSRWQISCRGGMCSCELARLL